MMARATLLFALLMKVQETHAEAAVVRIDNCELSSAADAKISSTCDLNATDVVIDGKTMTVKQLIDAHATLKGVVDVHGAKLYRPTHWNSCEHAYQLGIDFGSNSYTELGPGHSSDPTQLYTLSNGVTTQCLFENGHGWTLVYKQTREVTRYAGSSQVHMKLTGGTWTSDPTLPGFAEKSSINQVSYTKMDDRDIRQLCTGQYKIIQNIANANDIIGTQWCAFDNANDYKDDTLTPKSCGRTYSASRAYSDVGTASTWGFSSPELIVNNANSGSPVGFGGSALHSCTTTGGCNVLVFCTGGSLA